MYSLRWNTDWAALKEVIVALGGEDTVRGECTGVGGLNVEHRLGWI